VASILLVANPGLTIPWDTVAYLGAFFYIPLNATSFSFFVLSSLACDAVLVSNDYYTFIPTALTIRTVTGIPIYYLVQQLLNTIDSIPRFSRSVYYISRRSK
jgi:hypothetical protein